MRCEWLVVTEMCECSSMPWKTNGMDKSSRTRLAAISATSQTHSGHLFIRYNWVVSDYVLSRERHEDGTSHVHVYLKTRKKCAIVNPIRDMTTIQMLT